MVKIPEFYDVLQLLKEGCFGEVYMGTNKYSGEKVAIKVDKSGFGIRNESVVLQFLHMKKCSVVPPVIATGPGYLIVPLYSFSLEEYVRTREISPDHAHEIFANMVFLLKQVHSCGVVHRDIKPANFMFDSKDNMVLIDFGMASFFIDNQKRHIDFPTTKSTTMIGSSKYASIHVHMGISPVRRDDIISCALIYLYLLSNETDFTPIENANRENLSSLTHPIHLRNYEKKKLENIPKYSTALFSHLYEIGFVECPDYAFIINLAKPI